MLHNRAQGFLNRPTSERQCLFYGSVFTLHPPWIKNGSICVYESILNTKLCDDSFIVQKMCIRDRLR